MNINIDFDDLKERAIDLAQTGVAKALELTDTGVAKAKELAEISKLKVLNLREQDSIRRDTDPGQRAAHRRLEGLRPPHR